MSIAKSCRQFQHIFITTVIGFKTDYVEVEEGYNVLVEVNAFTPPSSLKDQFKFGDFAVTVEVNEALSAAKLGRPQLSIYSQSLISLTLFVIVYTPGDDFNFCGSNCASVMISGQLSSVLPGTVDFQILDDLVPGEVEAFAVDLSSAQLIDTFGTAVEVFVANSLTVKILDNDGQ